MMLEAPAVTVVIDSIGRVLPLGLRDVWQESARAASASHAPSNPSYVEPKADINARHSGRIIVGSQVSGASVAARG